MTRVRMQRACPEAPPNLLRSCAEGFGGRATLTPSLQMLRGHGAAVRIVDGRHVDGLDNSVTAGHSGALAVTSAVDYHRRGGGRTTVGWCRFVGDGDAGRTGNVRRSRCAMPRSPRGDVDVAGHAAYGTRHADHP